MFSPVAMSRRLAVSGGSALTGGVTRVRVVNPFQVVYSQVVYLPGDVADVPQSVAADWIRDGWLEPAE